MVGIVILNYNNASQTIGCVASLREHCRGDNWKLCIVDNASRAEVYEQLCAALPSEHIIRSQTNGGYARGNDLGCEYFATDPEVDKILILNDDTRFTMDSITPMEEYLDAHAECGVVFPYVVAADGSVDRACWRRQKRTRDLVMQAFRLPSLLGMKRTEFLPLERLDALRASLPVNGTCTDAGMVAFGGDFAQGESVTLVPPGSCMMLRKDVFQSLDWLDPGTFLYFEEHILCAKLIRAGLKSVLLPGVSITHLGAQTTAKQPSKAVYRHWRRSYLYFLKNYSGVSAPLRLILQARTWLKTI